MKLMKKLRKRWRLWQFQRNRPLVAERRALLGVALLKGKEQRFKER